jgi:hypothetical protein
LKPYRKTIQTAQGRELFDKLEPLHERFNRVWTKIHPLSRALKTKEALEIWSAEAAVVGQERARLLSEIIEQRRSVAVEKGKTAVATGESAKFWSMLILALSVISGGLLAFVIVRGINQALTKAVTELSEGAEQVSSASGQVSGSSSRRRSSGPSTNFMGVDDRKPLPPAQVAGVIGELTNMICGAVLSELESDANFDLGAPQWIHVRDGEPCPDITVGSPSICRFEFSEGALIFFFAFEEVA